MASTGGFTASSSFVEDADARRRMDLFKNADEITVTRIPPEDFMSLPNRIGGDALTATRGMVGSCWKIEGTVDGQDIKWGAGNWEWAKSIVCPRFGTGKIIGPEQSTKLQRRSVLHRYLKPYQPRLGDRNPRSRGVARSDDGGNREGTREDTTEKSVSEAGSVGEVREDEGSECRTAEVGTHAGTEDTSGAMYIESLLDVFQKHLEGEGGQQGSGAIDTGEESLEAFYEKLFDDGT